MSYCDILKNVNQYYTDTVGRYGRSPRGADWNSESGQLLRFDQLLRICDNDSESSIIDYGCGYGALSKYLRDLGIHCQYTGFDISRRMVEQAEALQGQLESAVYTCCKDELLEADYVIASGLFNVKLYHDHQEWERYVRNVLAEFDRLATKGFAFNMLTSYSDAEKMRRDLFYADPCFYFEFCKKRFSKHVALLHDYGLYEFTVLVRKSSWIK